MTTTNGTNASTAPAAEEAAAVAAAAAGVAAVNPQALGAALDEAVRKAIAAQMAGLAKDIAKAAFDAALTEEVIAGMEATAREAAAQAVAPPAELEETEEEPEPELKFDNTEQFVREYVAPCYAREVSKEGREGEIRWCPQWHEHAEAVARFDALFRAFEEARQGTGAEMSSFWRDHLDHHMGELLSPQGPFQYCSVAKGHHGYRGKLVPLPLQAAAEGSFQQPFEQLESGLVVLTGGSQRRGEVVLEFP